jgi:hypothetical protein
VKNYRLRMASSNTKADSKHPRICIKATAIERNCG